AITVRRGSARSTTPATTPRSCSTRTGTTSRSSTTIEAEDGCTEMTRYLISFDDGAMTFPEEDLPDVAEAAHQVVQEAKNSGVWVFGGGVVSQSANVVATDGTVTAGPYPETKAVIGGFSIVDVPSREEALA